MPSTYSNGRLPESILRRLDSGTATGRGRHVTTTASAVRWYGFRRDVQRETGVLLHISPGMNAYRDYAEQQVGRANACAAGNCLAAASAGSSSHGGNMAYPFTNWVRVDAMAFDIGDYWRIPWATFKRIAAKWGLEVGLITKAIAGIEEPWHIIDRHPYQPLAQLEAQYGVTLRQGADGVWRLADLGPTTPLEEDEMLALKIKAPDGVWHHALLGVGTFRHLLGQDNPDRRRNIWRADDQWLDTDIAELPILLRDAGCDLNIWDIRNGQFVVLDPLDGSVRSGNVWTASGATRAAIKGITLPKVDPTPIITAMQAALANAKIGVDVAAIANACSRSSSSRAGS